MRSANEKRRADPRRYDRSETWIFYLQVASGDGALLLAAAHARAQVAARRLQRARDIFDGAELSCAIRLLFSALETAIRAQDIFSEAEAGGVTDNADIGPVAFLRLRAAQQLAAAKRFHEAAGVALDAAMEAALDDLPVLYIPETLTEERLAETVRLAANLLAASKEALEAIQGAHLEADMAFRDEMALERETRKRETA